MCVLESGDSSARVEGGRLLAEHLRWRDDGPPSHGTEIRPSVTDFGREPGICR
ncbi:MAG: hypothetical protein AAGK21_06090 [Bacteroidota bacterium]